MTQSVQQHPPFYIHSQPVDLSALSRGSSQTPEEQLTEFETAALAKADHLFPLKQSSYRSQVRAFVNDLRTQISHMRTLGSDALQIHAEITKIIHHYDHSLNSLYEQNEGYHSAKIEVEEQNRATLRQIRAASINFTPFSPKKTHDLTVKEVLNRSVEQASPTTAPRISRAALSKSLANMDMREHLIDTSINANLMRAAGEAVVETAKAVCSVTQPTKKACKSVVNFVGWAGKSTLEVTGQKELVKQAILYWQSCEGSTLAETLVDHYGYAPEEAKAIAKQYVKDVGAIAAGTAGYGASSLALKAVKPLVKQVVKGAVVSGQGPRTPLSGPSPRFQAFVQAENKIQQKLSQPYRNFKIKANRHPKVPYSEVPRHPDVYFHTTSLEKACGILKTGSILRLDRGHFHGAFVSTQPEWLLYGDIVLVFNRSIEKVSEVLNAQFVGGRHWAGFSKSIPVTSESLEYIAVEADLLAKEPIEALAKQLSAAAGREIPVIPLDPIIEMVEKRALQEGFFVPEEWPISLGFQRKQAEESISRSFL